MNLKSKAPKTDRQTKRRTDKKTYMHTLKLNEGQTVRFKRIEEQETNLKFQDRQTDRQIDRH